MTNDIRFQLSFPATIFRLLVNRVDCYLGWNDHWVLRRQQLLPEMIEQARRGFLPLGVHAVSGVGTSRWTCFAVDDDARLEALIDLYHGLPLASRLLEISRRGAHVWFFHTSISWEFASLLGLDRAGLHGREGIEVYPRHGGFNAVRLLGTVHPNTGVRYPVIDPDAGRVLDVLETLRQIVPNPVETSALGITFSNETAPAVSTEEFDELIAESQTISAVRVYGEQKAAGLCP